MKNIGAKVKMCPNCGCAIWPNQLHVCSSSFRDPTPWVVVSPGTTPWVVKSPGTVSWSDSEADTSGSYIALLCVLAVAFLGGFVGGLLYNRVKEERS